MLFLLTNMKEREIQEILENRLKDTQNYKKIYSYRDKIAEAFFKTIWEDVMTSTEREMWQENPSLFDNCNNHNRHHSNSMEVRITFNKESFLKESISDISRRQDAKSIYYKLFNDAEIVLLSKITDPNFKRNFIAKKWNPKLDSGHGGFEIGEVSGVIIPEFVGDFFFNRVKIKLENLEDPDKPLQYYYENYRGEKIEAEFRLSEEYLRLCKEQYLLEEKFIKEALLLKESLLKLTKTQVKSIFPEILL